MNKMKWFTKKNNPLTLLKKEKQRSILQALILCNYRGFNIHLTIAAKKTISGY